MRYYNLSRYLKNRHGVVVRRIPLDAGLTCPNRDGTLSSRGCIFCDADGSGSGAARAGKSIARQLDEGLARGTRRADRFIAYFQSYTNTYAPTAHLKKMWDEAMSRPEVVGLAVGTRPDCLPDEVLDLLAGYAAEKEVWLELGLQSASNRTLEFINRGHTAEDFARAAVRATQRGLQVLAHVIIGLPGEGERENLETAFFITGLNLAGVKIHSLYVSKGTAMAEVLARGEYEPLTRADFVDRVVLFLENISPSMVIHRLTGDPAPEALIAPEWALDKNTTLTMIRRRLEEMDTWQGRSLDAPRPDETFHTHSSARKK